MTKRFPIIAFLVAIVLFAAAQAPNRSRRLSSRYRGKRARPSRHSRPRH